MKLKPAEVRKALAAVATGITQAIALGLLDGTAEKLALVGLAILGAYGVYRIPNKPKQD